VPGILYAEPNYIAHATALGISDEYKDYLWHLDDTGQNGGTAGKDVGAQTPWTAGKTGGSGNGDVIIATVDTGFDFTHPDIKDKVWTNNNTAKLAGKHGYDFSNYDGNPQDDNGHGTHVAGIIAAAHNNIGVAGVAPGEPIMPLK
jgi:subtilisin family serine protease